MQITVTVNDVDLNSVVGEAYDDEEGHRIPQTLWAVVAAKLVERLATSAEAAELVREISDHRRELVRDRTITEVEAALTGPVLLTNHYGEPTGKTTTLRDEIIKLASEQLAMDHRNSYSRELTTAQRVIREEVDRAIAAELAAVVKEEKEKVVAAVRAKAADLIAQAVKEGVGR